MNITSLNNFNVSQSKISFSKKDINNKEKHTNNRQTGASVSVQKLVPAMVALAGLTTLNSCSDENSYILMRELKDESFEALQGSENNLSKIEEKTLVLNMEKDSLYKETKDYKYRHLRIKASDHTRVFGEILRKEDNKALEFINVYNEDDELTSSTLKDPQTHETFYVSYEDGIVKKITNKEGKELPKSIYGQYLMILCMAVAIYGMGKIVLDSNAPIMTYKDVPSIEPPPLKEKDD